MRKTTALGLLAALLCFGRSGSQTLSTLLQTDSVQAVTDPDQRANLLVSKMTQAEKLQLVHGNLTLEKPLGPHNAVGWVPGIPRLGIPDLLYADASTVKPTTALPSSLAGAATWDLNEAYRFGLVTGKEMRASGMNVSLLGNVNLTAREPRDGRTFETKGEDPILAGRIAAAQLKGIQHQFVLVGPKHVAMNDQETARTQANAVIGERAARESDLLAFEIAVKGSGAQMAMCAYNLLNGKPSCANDHLLNAVLKKEWGFKGFVLSDWYATPSSVAAALGGLDQEHPGGYMFDGVWTAESLQAALGNGDFPVARLNDMVHRILRAMIVTGVMDHPANMGTIDVAGDAAIAQEIEEQGAVLLKNRGPLLPLSKSVASIAVIGSHADVGVLSGGGSAQIYPMGGAALTLPPECPPYVPPPGGLACTNSNQIYNPSSPLKAIRAKAPSANVTYNEGKDAAAAAKIAAAAQVAIVFVNRWESEGMDLVNLNLPDGQNSLVSAVAAKNPRTIVVLENGGPVILPWLGNVSAVLESWYPGQKGGEAIANILFGSVNPSGKLPITFPASVQDLPRPTIPIPNPPASTSTFNVNYNIEGSNVGYKWFEAKSIPVEFPFGFGLSYTTFLISNLKLTPNATAGSGFQVSFVLANTGIVAGAEAPQVYLAMPAGAGEPKRLVGWTKVKLQPGARQRVTISINGNDASHPLSVWKTATSQWATPAGLYTVYVGTSSAPRDLEEAGTFRVEP